MHGVAMIYSRSCFLQHEFGFDTLDF